jgi:hypothetical protein
MRGPTAADRMLAAQLFGTTAVAVLLLLAEGMGEAYRCAISRWCSRCWPRWRRSPSCSGSGAGEATMSPIDLLSAVLVLGGAAFFFAGTVGMLRFPDVFSRLHALTKGDNVGLGLTVLGLALRAESWRRSASCC